MRAPRRYRLIMMTEFIYWRIAFRNIWDHPKLSGKLLGTKYLLEIALLLTHKTSFFLSVNVICRISHERSCCLRRRQMAQEAFMVSWKESHRWLGLNIIWQRMALLKESIRIPIDIVWLWHWVLPVAEYDTAALNGKRSFEVCKLYFVQFTLIDSADHFGLSSDLCLFILLDERQGRPIWHLWVEGRMALGFLLLFGWVCKIALG
jgi:hypothetical protein